MAKQKKYDILKKIHKYVSLMLYKTEVKEQLTFKFNFIKSHVEKSLNIYA